MITFPFKRDFCRTAISCVGFKMGMGLWPKGRETQCGNLLRATLHATCALCSCAQFCARAPAGCGRARQRCLTTGVLEDCHVCEAEVGWRVC